MSTDRAGRGRFTLVTLRPEVRLAAGDTKLALALHEDAHRMCFIANSVSVAVVVEPSVVA